MPPSYLPDSNWSERTHAIPFQQMIHLNPHPTTQDTFISTSAAYPPTPTTRTFGGHVIAQAAYAACATVPFGLHVHSITGYFLSVGDTQWPYRYVVRRIRDGGVYSVRSVDAYQDVPSDDDSGGSKTATVPMFVAIVGFKRDEAIYHKEGHKKRRRDFGHQSLPKDWLETQYGDVLGKRPFEEFTMCQGMDALWPEPSMSLDEWKKRADVFPGLEMRKVDMPGQHEKPCEGAISDGGQLARSWRCLQVYRYIDEKEEDDAKTMSHRKKKKSAADDELNLHACAHIYASDRNGLFSIQRALGMGQYTGQMGSLSHTVNFHGGVETLRMMGDNGRAKEFVQESWCGGSGDDRICHESRIWDRDAGVIIATTTQDGMMRIPVAQHIKVNDGEAMLRRQAKL